MFVGVEISHCTGNARRIRLVDLLCLEKVRERLSRSYLNWEHTPWGELFLQAIGDQSFEAIRQVWRYHRDIREDIGKLIAPLLELLHLTGSHGNYLVAAYFGGHTDRNLELDIQGNEWASCLRDSVSTATYAVINNVCLTRRGQATATCDRGQTNTVFETRIIFQDELPMESDDIRLDPIGGLFRIDRIIRNSRVKLIPRNRQLAMRWLPPTLKACEVVERTGTREVKKEFSATIKAPTPSYGGMQRGRQLPRLAAQPRVIVLGNQQQQQINHPLPPPPALPPQHAQEHVQPPRLPRQSQPGERQRQGRNNRRRHKPASKKTSSCCFQ